MKAPARLGLYGLALVIVFVTAGFTANLVVTEDAVQNWLEDTQDHNGSTGYSEPTNHDEPDNHGDDHGDDHGG